MARKEEPELRAQVDKLEQWLEAEWKKAGEEARKDTHAYLVDKVGELRDQSHFQQGQSRGLWRTLAEVRKILHPETWGEFKGEVPNDQG